MVSSNNSEPHQQKPLLENDSSCKCTSDPLSHRPVINERINAPNIPLPPPLPLLTTAESSKSSHRTISNSASNLLMSPFLMFLSKGCKISAYEGEIGSAPAIDENCILKYIALETVIQVGPTCGIFALKMIVSLFRDMEVHDILTEARQKSYTNHGEIFSAKNMFELAKNLVHSELCDVRLHQDIFPGGEEEVWTQLANNVIFLVPYDADKNFAPTKLGGRKAHWAALIGACIFNGQKYVCGVQGHSLRVAAWPITQLSESNAQLLEPDPLAFSLNYLVKDLSTELKGTAISFTLNEKMRIKCMYGMRSEI